MSDMNEFYEQHLDNCEYCQSISEDQSLSKDVVMDKIDQHTMSAYEELADRAWDEYKERESV